MRIPDRLMQGKRKSGPDLGRVEIAIDGLFSASKSDFVHVSHA